MSDPVLTPPDPEIFAPWSAAAKRAGHDAAADRRHFAVALVLSLCLHVAGVAAIAIYETGPRQQSAAAANVDLVSRVPSPNAHRQLAKSAAAKPVRRKPPPSPPPLLRKPPPEPPQAHSESRSEKNRKRLAPRAAARTMPEPSLDGQHALPFFAMPSELSSRALSGQGEAGDSYKGLVFGMLARAERRAASHARGETGQAIVSFSVDAKGRLVSLALAQSSGHADLDADALSMVRRVAPFPPPPSGATRTFAAAIDFGEQ